ncbi:hypothetical protein PF007_g18390 [Phytophthora fragariae]|uniref:Uncharacterized protein n=1 Tax=Phytophthora fragariae TaxID=53985 RepID=A0A6A3RC26_9STRA|nr:hypothetical protein PF007_g18390 [Phytophthora fragariae]
MNAPAQMPAMWRGEFAPATATAHAASAASAIPTDADVASEVAGAVASIVSTIMGEASNAPAGVMSCSQPADASRSGKRKRVETMESRKRRRRILQGESGDDDEVRMLAKSNIKLMMLSYETKFGPDPTYADLYDGSYGPTNNVLAVAEDPLALLFYFMSPKLWAQIAVESNTYHRQSIPQRARAIRAQQRKGGGEVEDLGDIRRRLDGVEDIDA